MRKVFSAVFAIVCAILGAAAGKAIVRWRTQSAAGRQPQLDLWSLRPGPREVIPGLVAALRVHDRPWSYLHIPSWLAAFAINVAVSALAQEVAPILRALGIEAPDNARGGGEQPRPAERVATIARGPGITRAEVWTAEVIPPASTAPPPPGFRPFGS